MCAREQKQREDDYAGCREARARFELLCESREREKEEEVVVDAREKISTVERKKFRGFRRKREN